MIEYWRKINIDQFINDFFDFYLDSSRGHFKNSHIVDTLNEEERAYVNEKINISKLVEVEPQFIFHKLFKENKINFSKYLLTTSGFDIDVNGIDKDGTTIFQLLLKYDLFYSYLITLLYNHGYRNTKHDEEFLTKYYKENITSQQNLENWCLARVCYKLNNPSKIEKALSKDRVILSILSFKLNRPIGFNFANLLSVANNAIQNYREQGDIILLTMKHYNVYDEVTQRDRKGSFKHKVEDFYKFKPIQDLEFTEIVHDIFPELKNKAN